MKNFLLVLTCFFLLNGLSAQTIPPATTVIDTVVPAYYIPLDSNVISYTAPPVSVLPAPGSDFSSFRVSIYLPKNKIWIDRMICGPELPADLQLFIAQGKGMIVIYDCIWISSVTGEQHGEPRKYILGENGQFKQVAPGFQWKSY